MGGWLRGAAGAKEALQRSSRSATQLSPPALKVATTEKSYDEGGAGGHTVPSGFVGSFFSAPPVAPPPPQRAHSVKDKNDSFRGWHILPVPFFCSLIFAASSWRGPFGEGEVLHKHRRAMAQRSNSRLPFPSLKSGQRQLLTSPIFCCHAYPGFPQGAETAVGGRTGFQVVYVTWLLQNSSVDCQPREQRSAKDQIR